MHSKLLLACLATVAFGQPRFGGLGDDSGDQSDPTTNSRRPPPRPRQDGGQGMGMMDGQRSQRPPMGSGDSQEQGPPSQRGPMNQGSNNRMQILNPEASLMTIITMGPERGRDHCGRWGDWKEVRCWWPDQNFSSLPEECTNITYPRRVPAVLQKFIDGKIQEVYSVIQAAYKRRGSPPKCGHCTHSFKCRSRNMTRDDMDMDMGGMDMGDMDGDDSDQMNGSEMGMGSGMMGMGDGMDRHRPRPRPRPRPGQCKPKEIRPMDDVSCDDEKACKVSAVGGGCPAPLFLHKNKVRRINEMMMNGDHNGALNALDSLQYDDNHVDIGDNSDDMDDMNDDDDDDDDDDDSMNMDMNSDDDEDPFNNNSGRKKRQSGFYDPSNMNGMGPGMMMNPSMMGQGMQMNGPWQSRNPWTGSSQSQNPFLQWRRQDRQTEMGRGGAMNGFFGMQDDDFRGNRFGRQQGSWDDWRRGDSSNWNRRRPWGPPSRGDYDDDRRGPQRGGWRDWDQDEPRRGPGSRRPYDWDQDDDRMGPRRGGWDRDDRRGVPGWNQRGRDWDRDGMDRGRRRPPPPPPPPRRRDEEDSREDRMSRFGHMGMGMGQQFGGPGGMDRKHHGKHGKGGRGGKGRRGGKGGKAKLLANLLHGTNCISSGSDCLCCCGGYIPDAASGDCRDIRQMMPGLEGLLSFAMKKSGPPEMPEQMASNDRQPQMNF